MLIGQVRDHLPLLRLDLPGYRGPITVELVVDTGFDGHFALPRNIVRELDARISDNEIVALADGSRRPQTSYEMVIEWFDDEMTSGSAGNGRESTSWYAPVGELSPDSRGNERQ